MRVDPAVPADLIQAASSGVVRDCVSSKQLSQCKLQM